MCQSLSRVAHISPNHGNVHQHHGKVPLDEEKVPPLSHGTNPAAWLGRLAFGGICTRKPPSVPHMEWQMADAGEGERIGHGGAEGRNVIAACVQMGVVSGYRRQVPQVPHVSQVLLGLLSLSVEPHMVAGQIQQLLHHSTRRKMSVSNAADWPRPF